MSPDDVKHFRTQVLGLSAEKFARAMGLTGKDAGRTVRRWEAEDKSAKSSREVPEWLATIERAAREVPGFAAWLIARAGKGNRA